MKTCLALLLLLSLFFPVGALHAASGIQNLPPEFYARKGLEKLPRIDYQSMPVVNVVDFGADPSGRNIVNEAFDKAVEALGKKGGGVLFVPRGVFRFRSPELKADLRWSWRNKGLKNIHIVGAGAEKTLITVDFNAVGETSRVPGYLWNFTGCENMSVREIGFSQFPRFGMRSPGACEGVFALSFGDSRRIQVLRVTVDQGRMGICFWPLCKEIAVIDCDVRNTGADGIKFDSCIDTLAAYNYLEGINDDSFSGLHMAKGLSENNHFLRNVLVNNYGWGRGIAISGRNHHVEENWVEAQAMAGLLLHSLGFKEMKVGKDHQNTGHVIQNNTFVRCDLHAIKENLLAGHRYSGTIATHRAFTRVQFTGNRVFGSASHGFGIGLFEKSRLDQSKISKNDFEGNLGYGLAIGSVRTNAGAEELTLKDNLFASNRSGSVMLLGNFPGMIARGNRVDSNPACGMQVSALKPAARDNFQLEKVKRTYVDCYA
ncbi:MAG: right-handed parallel beta-helix repeat-containing protein, partial [Victivallaceae bacterium]|nr:right-handed parallel beta-helix repeat-containing protein [Victivallaceae bacterium]